MTDPVAAAAIGILLLGEHLRAAGTVIAGRQLAATLPHTPNVHRAEAASA